MKLKTTLKSALYIVDIFLFAAAPLFLILLLVCVIAFIDRYNQHSTLVKRLESYGQSTIVTLETAPDPELGYHVSFKDEAGEARYGFLNPQYYPPAVTDSLEVGSQINILYLAAPHNYDSNVVLADRFEDVKGYYGYATDIAILFIVCWLIVAFHPEFLYLGFTDASGAIVKQLMKQPAPWQGRQAS